MPTASATAAPPPGDGAISGLRERLTRGEFAFTAEVTPPASCDAADLIRLAAPLRGLADAVNVTDGAGAHAHMGPLAAGAILIREGIAPVLQFTCRDRNRIALQSDLMGAAALGIENILILNGDDPKAGDQPQTKPVFDLTSDALAETARGIRDARTLPSGRKVGGTATFFIGGADMPVDPTPGWRPDRLRAKKAAGMEFIQTQFCMDGRLLRRYLARLREEGLVPDLHYLVGIAPLRSAKSARWMREKLFGTTIPDAVIARMDAAADPVAEGIAVCVDLIEELRGIQGIGGVHIMAPLNEVAIPEVIAKARARLGETPPN